jgi:hypothetical protein
LFWYPNISIVKRRNWLVGFQSLFIYFLVWTISNITNPWVTQHQKSKFTCIGSTMTMLTKMWIPSLVNAMSTCWQEELKVVEGSICSCFHPNWKPTSCVMVAKSVANYIMGSCVLIAIGAM